MIQKVRFTYTVDVYIKGNNEEQIMDYARNATPSEALEDAMKNGRYVAEEYDEFVLSDVKDDSEYDIDLTEGR